LVAFLTFANLDEKLRAKVVDWFSSLLDEMRDYSDDPHQRFV
jgi:hypothetical protein